MTRLSKYNYKNLPFNVRGAVISIRLLDPYLLGDSLQQHIAEMLPVPYCFSSSPSISRTSSSPSETSSIPKGTTLFNKNYIESPRQLCMSSTRRQLTAPLPLRLSKRSTPQTKKLLRPHIQCVLKNPTKWCALISSQINPENK